MKRVMISAGEASGDIHAGAITAALKEIDKDIFFLVCDSYEVSKQGDLIWTSK